MISTVYQMVEHMEKNYAEQIAFQYYSESDHKVVRITFAQYCEDIRNYAFYLKGNLPNIEGMHIGIIAKNSYRYFVCLLGIIIAKGVAVPLNPDDGWRNIQTKISFADIDCLLADNEFLGVFNFSESKTILLDMDGTGKKEWLVSDLERCQADKPCIMIFTSGTTGKIKCAVFSQKNIFAPMQAFKKATGSLENQLLTQPFYHVSGITFVMTGNIMGITTNMCNSIQHIYRDLKVMKCNYSSVVPMLLNDFYKQVKKAKIEKLGGLQFLYCGGASVNTDMFETFSAAGISVAQAYGLTEIFGGGTTNASGRRDKVQSVGVPGVGCELKIENDEICLKSDAVMLGYYKDEEATKEAIQDGWLHTGDLGYLDEDGFLYLTGRKKNLIILSNGENISAEEIEGELLKNPDVWETIVREKNDKICAVIYCAPEKQEQIRNYISEENRGKPLWKRITEVEFRDKPFEKTGTGKIIRSL